MMRLFVRLILLTGVAFILAWLSQHQGEFAISVAGYRVETSLFFATVFALVVLGAFIAVLWVVSFVWSGPQWIIDVFSRGKQKRGQRALRQALFALRGGDVVKAKKALRLLPKDMHAHYFAVMLKADLARETGHKADLIRLYQLLKDNPDTALVGLRLEYDNLIAGGDYKRALHTVEDVLNHGDHILWALEAKLKLATRLKSFSKARGVLDRLKSEPVYKHRYKRLAGALWLAEGLEAFGDGERVSQLCYECAQKAYRFDPTLVPAVVLMARYHIGCGELRAAARVIEKSYKVLPHPHLVDVYLGLREGDGAEDRVRRAFRLAGLSGDHVESALMCARMYVENADPQAALTVIDPYLSEQSALTPRLCLVRADIARLQGDHAGFERWIFQAIDAPSDATWTIDGMPVERWMVQSQATGEIGVCVWDVPDPRYKTRFDDAQKKILKALLSQSSAKLSADHHVKALMDISPQNPDRDLSQLHDQATLEPSKFADHADYSDSDLDQADLSSSVQGDETLQASAAAEDFDRLNDADAVQKKTKLIPIRGLRKERDL